MTIIQCGPDRFAEWDAFVDASPRSSFYHRSGWQAINARCFGHQSAYLAAVKSGRIVGVLPLVRIKSLAFGNLACSMPFVNYGGPAGETDAVEDALLEAAAGVIEDWGSDYLEIRSCRRLSAAYPCAEHKVSMTLELESDPEVLMGRFKRDQRAEIRRATKNGFVAKFGPEHLDDFYDVLSESWRELGTPIFGFSYLRAIVKAFPARTRICVIYAADGTPAAGAFDGIQNGTVEGMWLGMRPEYRRQLVGYVLYWELIRHACEQGYRRFHLGRSSKDSGGEVFKKKWNAEAMQLYWHYLLRTRSDIPNLNPSNPKYARAIDLWRRLPVGVTQIVGPLLAGSIP